MTVYRNCLSCTNEIYNLYEQYAELQGGNEYVHETVYSDLDRIRKGLEKEDYFLANLNVDCTVQQIKNIFEVYQVIQLRPIGDSTTLLLGCGNDPVDPSFKDEHHCHEDHSHTGMVTINPELSMNATIVGAFGVDEGLNDLLPKGKFKNLYGERVTIALSASNFMGSAIAKKALECLTSDFKTFEVGQQEPFSSFANSNFFWESDIK